MLKGVNLKVSQKRRNGTYNTGRGRLCCILKSLLNMKITLFLKLFNLPLQNCPILKDSVKHDGML